MDGKSKSDLIIEATSWYSVIKSVDLNAKCNLIGIVKEHLLLDGYIDGSRPHHFAVAVRGPLADKKSLPLSKKAIRYSPQYRYQLRSKELKTWGTPEERTWEEEKSLRVALKNKIFVPRRNYYRNNKALSDFALRFAQAIHTKPISVTESVEQFRSRYIVYLSEIINWRVRLDLISLAGKKEDFISVRQVNQLIYRKK